MESEFEIGANDRRQTFQCDPVLIGRAERPFSKPGAIFGNCLKGCQWAPDGSCLCTNSDDHCIRIFNLPERILQASEADRENQEPEPEELLPVLQLRESQIIYDYCWFPFMNSSDYATCFLLCCSRDVPIHLWDAYAGKIHASYTAVNYVHELVSARSVRFSTTGTRILAGYEKFLCIFDLARPGAYGDYIRDIPKGIVSCLATGSEKLFAAGSFGRLIGLYDSGGANENIAMLQGHRGGVTHLRLSADGQRLYSGARKDDEILCWDLRNYGEILHIIKRKCPTNQRIYFDVDFQHNLLVTGDDGAVKFFDLESSTSSESKIISCRNQFQSHQNRVNGVSLHPSLSLLATTSGQRCLLDFDDNQEDDSIIFDYKRTYSQDNNLKLWWFGHPTARQQQLSTAAAADLPPSSMLEEDG